MEEITLTPFQRRIYEAIWNGATLGKPPSTDELRTLFYPVATHAEIKWAVTELERLGYLVAVEKGV